MPDQLTGNRICRVAALYSIAAVAWIFISDSVLLAATSVATDVRSYQTAKGIFFIAITTVALVWLLHAEQTARRKDQRRYQQETDALRTRLLRGSAPQALPELDLDSEQRESLLYLLLDHAPASLAMFDVEMNYLYASQRWLDEFDLHESPVGRCHYDVFPDLPQRWRDIHARSLAGEILDSSEDSFIRPNGDQMWLAWQARPWYQSNGKIGGIVIFIEDQTESRTLADRTALAVGVFESANDAIMITDAQAKIIEVNSAFTTITGYEAEDVCGLSPKILHSGKQDGAFYQRMWESLRSTGNWYGEIINRRKDGSHYPQFLTITAIRNRTGEVMNYVGHFLDLSHERQAEENLANITGSMRDIVYTVDRDKRHTGVYGPWVEAFGLSPDYFLGKTPEEILGPNDGKVHSDAIARALTGEPTVYQWSVETAMGAKDFQISLSPVRDSDSQITGLVGVGRDVTDLISAQRETARQVERLSSLRSVDAAIAGTFDINVVLRVVIDQVIEHLDVRACSVLLLDQHSQTLTYAAGRGFKTRAIERTRMRLGDGIAGRALLEGKRIRQTDPLHSLFFSRAELLADERIADFYAVPMIAKGRMIGVLEVYIDEVREASDDWLMFLDTLAGLAAIAVDSARLFKHVQRSNLDLVMAYDATIEGWSKALDLRDKETEGHTQRVTELTEELARRAGVAEAELAHIRRGALLHDIGKMGIRDNILLKEGPLTDEEWVEMRKHPELAYQMLAPITFLRPALDIPYCHHEKWDGTGYPRALKGEQIPYSARLFAVVDVWDALRSDRPYRPAWSRERILAHIESLRGTHFEPRVVDLFLELMQERGDELESALGYDRMGKLAA